MSTSGSWIEQSPCSKISIHCFLRTNTIPLNRRSILCLIINWWCWFLDLQYSEFRTEITWILQDSSLWWPNCISWREAINVFLSRYGLVILDLQSNSIQDCVYALNNFDHGNGDDVFELMMLLKISILNMILRQKNVKNYINLKITQIACHMLHLFVYKMKGRYDYNPWKHVDDIPLYSMKNNKWKLLKVKLPVPLSKCTCVCTKVKRFTFTFDGEDRWKNHQANVPWVDETEKSDLIITGFMDECWNYDDFRYTIKWCHWSDFVKSFSTNGAFIHKI